MDVKELATLIDTYTRLVATRGNGDDVAFSLKTVILRELSGHHKRSIPD